MLIALSYEGGKVTDLARDQVMAAVELRRPGQLVWIHVQANGDTGSFLDELPLELPPTVRNGLMAVETRPRCDAIGEGMLVNLRVPTLVQSAPGAGDLLVSMRLWAIHGMVISVSFRPSAILPSVEAAFREGKLHDPGDLLILIASLSAEVLDPVIAAIGDQLDGLECNLGPQTPFSERRRVTQLRTNAIEYRRFVAPQRLALDRLAQSPIHWLDDLERAAVREASDRFARMSEELESVRERAAVLHEELTDLRAEKIDARSLQIAIVAMIFLPLTFVTGLLGMNVDGIPYAHHPGGFWIVTGLCTAIAGLMGAWFWYSRWINS